MTSVVFDTNVYISVFVAGGTVRRVFILVRSKKIKLFVCAKILLEVAEKLRTKFLWDEERINFTIEAIGLSAKIIEPRRQVKVVRADPSDDKILACAAEAKADYLVTGDKHLLNLREYKEIKIITPAQLFILLGARR